MFNQLSFKRFSELASCHQRVAIFKQIPGDRLTPTNTLLFLKTHFKSNVLLESDPKEKNAGRFSHLCFDPILSIESLGTQVSVLQNGTSQTINTDPLACLRDYQSKLSCAVDHPHCGFLGGMVGFISYDAIRLTETIGDRHENKDNIPDLLFRFYRNNITFDHQTGKVILATIVEADSHNLEKCYTDAISQLNQLQHNLLHFQEQSEERLKQDGPQETKIEVDINDDDFCQLVNTAKQSIRHGDVFQVVISRNFSIQTNATPFNIYRALKYSNPSPYMFYIEADNYTIAGASPEKLISIDNRVIESCPLAGTRLRGLRPDHLVEQELLADEKETAEHMMLIDLCRNDLGKLSKPGSVVVTKQKQIEKFTRVMHISSTVQGQLKEGVDALEALMASAPAGTLTGAPKIKAMQLIDQLEANRRGVYGGAICGIDHQGNLTSCIAIRTTFIKDGIANVRAGAGIVFDSDPQAEADETRHKAKAVLEGILFATGDKQ